MDKISNKWFCLETTTFVFKDSRNYFLYNSESGDKIISARTNQLDKFMEQIQNVNNMYCVPIENVSPDSEVMNLIDTLRNKYMGDLVVSNTSPVGIAPIFKCHSDKPQEDIFYSLGTSIMSLVNEMTFYINGQCSQNCNFCNKYYKQFVCCHKSNNRLKLEDIISKIENYSSTAFVKTNICGGNIFLYEKINELISYLQSNNVKSNFYFNYLNWDEKYINLLDSYLFYFHIHINFPIVDESLQKIMNSIEQVKGKVHFTFIVTSNKEYELTEELIFKYELDWVDILPFYNENLSFFKDFVYTNISDIIAAKPNKHEIFKRQQVNTYDFGKLIINSSGDIYANINHPTIGHIKEEVTQIVLRELQRGESWKRLRTQYPCNNCIYQYLCPSPSSYEIVIGRNNLCNIK